MLASLYFVSLGMALLVLARWPHLILRPSVWFCLGMIVRINGAAAFDTVEILQNHPEPDLVRLMPILFPFGVAAWVLGTPGIGRQAHTILTRCTAPWEPGWAFGIPEQRLAVRIGFVSAGILACYLLFVPIGSLGIVKIFTDPINAASAREESLKLIGFAPLRYAYIWHINTLAPILAGLVVWAPSRRFLFGRPGKAALLFAIMLSAALSGARTYAGMIIVILGLHYVLRRGPVRGVPKAAALVAGVVMLVTLLSVIRDGRAAYLTPSLFFQYLSGGIFQRIFVVPFQSGVLNCLYAHEYGLLGVSNIRPLALLFGVEYVQLPNLVGLAYMTTRILSVSANTCFLFDFQASFGLVWGWVVSLGAVAALDAFLPIFLRLRGGLLITMLAVSLMAQHSLISSSYLTCLVSHGILLGAALAYYFGIRFRKIMNTRG